MTISEMTYFKGLKVVDLARGMAPALVTSLLHSLGSSVTRIEPADGDPFYTVYPAYRIWHQGAKRVDVAQLEELIAQADICITGGEDYPGLSAATAPSDLPSINPRLIVLDIAGSIARDGARLPAVDVLAQARSGLAFEHHPDRPVHLAFRAPTYGAAIQGLFGLLCALFMRDRSGASPQNEPRLVSTSLEQGALMWLVGDWMSAERPDRLFDFNIPKGVQPLVFQCADGGYLHLVTGTPGSLAKLYSVLGIDVAVDPADRGLPNPAAGLKNFFGSWSLLAEYVRKQPRDELLQALWREGIAAEPVLAPGESWQDQQTICNGIIQTTADHTRHVGNPITVRRDVPGEKVGPTRRRSVPPIASDALPLAGVKVVDLGTFVAGPYASKLLSDFGAEVIKIETQAGDPSRMIYRNFFSVNAGKRSVCIDAKTDDGRRLIQAICASADIVHHNYRPGVVERLGVSPADLIALNPGIVTLGSYAYGATGPKARNSGFDMIMQAFCGHELSNAGESNAPLWVRSALVDYATGGLGAVALLIGLLEREASGSAIQTEVDLLSSGLWMLSELIQTSDGVFSGAPGNNHWQTGLDAFEAFYQVSDGWIAIAARSPACRELLLNILGIPGETQSESELGERIASRLLTETIATALCQLREGGIWAESCARDGWEVLKADATAREAGLVLRNSGGRYGQIDAINALITISGVSRPAARNALCPGKGQHTDQVMTELGYQDGEIAEMRQRLVIA